MSKSIPGSCVYIHDTPKEIETKIGNAFCPAKVVDDNPVLDLCKHIIFREFDSFEIKRTEKFGGPVSFESYNELEPAFRSGKVHPLDLKAAVAKHLADVLKPAREYFEKNKNANELYNFVKSLKTTR